MRVSPMRDSSSCERGAGGTAGDEGRSLMQRKQGVCCTRGTLQSCAHQPLRAAQACGGGVQLLGLDVRHAWHAAPAAWHAHNTARL